MNIPLFIANLLALLGFIAHTFIGTKELGILLPRTHPDSKIKEIWSMGRGGWHMVSLDLFLATLALGLVNFTEDLLPEKTTLYFLALYFALTGMVWLINVAFSPPFPKRFLKLGQWILLWMISGLVYWGATMA